MTGPRERAGMLPAEGIVDRLPQRRLADRLLDDSHREAGREVAAEYASQDRLDPLRPTLSTIVATVVAEAEERGREEVRALLRRHVEAVHAKADRLCVEAAGFLSRGSLGPAATAARFAEEQARLAAVLGLVLAGEEPK